MYSRWFAIVKDYTSRNLSVQSDILPALSGLASAFQNLLRDQYCAGLWKNDIIRGMCWWRSDIPTKDFTAIKARQRKRDDFIPSWSWASVIGYQVINEFERENRWPSFRLDEMAQVLKVRIIPKTSDVLGQIAHAEITIRAPFQYIDDPNLETSAVEPAACPSLRKLLVDRLRILQQEYVQQHRPHRGQKFAVVRLRQTMGLLDTPGASILVLESTGEADRWRRVGLIGISVPFNAEADDEDWQCLDEMKRASWKWKKVIIV